MRRENGWRMPMLGSLALLAMLSSGCGSTVFDACPTIVIYPPEIQDRAADELAALPPEAVLGHMMADYAGLRDQARACRGSM